MSSSGLYSGSLLKHGEYRIERVLGQGGFGITYEAEQVSLVRKVAVKEFFMKDICNRDEATSRVIVPSVGSKELVLKFKDKFIREAKMIAGLDHEHIVKIFDVFEENGTAYYVMEYLGGGSLDRMIKDNGAMLENEAVGFIRQIASALDYLHSQNILHFDVKPSNVLLGKNGCAKLIDFGISKHYDEAGVQTSSTPVGISKGYTPLEQYKQGSDINSFTPATDVYALGATLYALLAGSNPPEASDVNDDGLPVIDAVSPAVMRAIEKSMQPRRKDRPQSVAEFLKLLDDPIVNDEETIVPEPKPVQAPQPIFSSKPVRKGFPKWLYGLIAGVVMAVLAVVLINRSDKADTPDNMLTGSSTVVDEYFTDAPATTGVHNGHEWVDLGLSVKWATCNVGATTPDGYGSYFAWSETSPKSSYYWTNLKYYTEGYNWDNIKFSKYVAHSRYGPIDNRTTLELSDDAAHTNWGGSWRMPTRAEQYELIEKCTWTWTTMNGKNGYKVTSKSNGNSIFLPAAGVMLDSSLISASSDGYYWSSSLDEGCSGCAYHLSFPSGEVKWYDVFRTITARSNGQSVRPVCP